MRSTDYVIGILGAWLFFIGTNGGQIIIAFKSLHQMTREEKDQIKRGLRKALLIEFFLLVPVGAILLLLVAPIIVLILIRRFSFSLGPYATSEVVRTAFFAFLGAISYRFPFQAFRNLIIRTARAAIEEWMSKGETKSQSQAAGKLTKRRRRQK